jgi:transposase InsO family protein
MKKHLRVMSNMVNELKDAGHTLTDEQQIQAIIRSLPNSWEHMKMHLTHNVHIQTMEDAQRHLELEEERLRFNKSSTDVYMAGSSSQGGKGHKRKSQSGTQRGKGKGEANKKPKKDKGKGPAKKKNKNIAKVKCFNCGNKGHFARDCTEPKKVNDLLALVSAINVSSSVFLTESNPLWTMDSGATDHIAKDRDAFVDYRRLPYGARWIYVGNNSRVEVKGIGSCKLIMRGGRTLILHDVLFAPEIRRNLVSVLVLIKLGFTVNFYKDGLNLFLDSSFYGSGYILNGFIVLDVINNKSNNVCFSMFTSTNESLNDMNAWHARLGHIGQQRMQRLAKEGLLGNINKVELSTCEYCLIGKTSRKPFGKGTRADSPLKLIHSDICGPMNIRARHGAIYFITFIDDFTRFGYVYLISHKSEALSCFMKFLNLVENQLDRKVKALRTDRGREYLSDQFRQLCDEKGIERQLTIPGTPQQNGVAERRNRTLLEMVRSMMAQANLPITYWGDALLTATYVLNRVPTKSVTSTPYELWTTRKPDLSFLKPWGCAAIAHESSHKFGKLGPRGKKCIFIRYSEQSKGHVFIHEQENGSITEFESRDVTFLENDFPRQSEIGQDLSLFETHDQDASAIQIQPDMLPSGSNLDNDEFVSSESQLHPEASPMMIPGLSGSNQGIDESTPLRRTSRKSIPRRRFDIEGEAFIVTPDYEEPRNVNEALSCYAKEEWIKAMEEEMESMKSNQVWELVDLPKGRKAIGNKWVLKIKRNADGSIERYKARLVAKGYTQQEGIDYEETFSPVVRFTSIRLILAIVANLDLELHQMDVKTAFLNGELEEEIYMEQPIAFIKQGQEHKVCRLLKSIYGLKQSSRQWYIRFHNAIISYDFKMINEDHCVYIKRSKDKFIILSLYVDDILIAGNDKEYVETIKGWLSSNFEMKDMGEATYILGVKISRDRSKRSLSLSQEPYINKVLERFNMKDCKPIDTPISKGEVLSQNLCPKTPQEKEQMKNVPYASAVGSLMYAMMCTRPDICYAVGMVSRYQSDPGQAHWKAVKRILRYLKGTAGYSLCYQGGDMQLRGYTDADWGGDLDERKSTSGYVFLLNNGAISWSSKKQSCIALSTMEAEFVAFSAAVQEAVWLKRFLIHLGVFQGAVDPVTVNCDSQAAIAYTKDPKYHGKTKHIDIKYNFVRDMVAQKEVNMKYISTHEMVADPFTKPIVKDVFYRHVKSLGLRRCT